MVPFLTLKQKTEHGRNSDLLINVCIDQLNLGEQKNLFFAQNKASKPCIVGM